MLQLLVWSFFYYFRGFIKGAWYSNKCVEMWSLCRGAYVCLSVIDVVTSHYTNCNNNNTDYISLPSLFGTSLLFFLVFALVIDAPILMKLVSQCVRSICFSSNFHFGNKQFLYPVSFLAYSANKESIKWECNCTGWKLAGIGIGGRGWVGSLPQRKPEKIHSKSQHTVICISSENIQKNFFDWNIAVLEYVYMYFTKSSIKYMFTL